MKKKMFGDKQNKQKSKETKPKKQKLVSEKRSERKKNKKKPEGQKRSEQKPRRQKKSRTGRQDQVMGMPLRNKSILFVAIMILLTAAATMLVAMPQVHSIMRDMTQNYIYDLADSNGRILDIEVYSYGVNVGLSEENLKELFENVKVKGVDNSYAYVVAADGNVVYHPSADLIGKPAKNEAILQAAKEINAGKEVEPGVANNKVDGEMKYEAYYVNPRGCFILVVSANEEDVLGTANVVAKVMAVSAGLASIVCLVIAFIGFQLMFAPLKKIAEIVSRMGDLNFTRVPELDKLYTNGDETGLMARSVCVVQDKLGKVVSELQGQSQQLYQSSDSLNSNAAATAETIGQINHAVHDMAEGATSQAVDTQAATESVIMIGNMVEETNREVAKFRKNVEVMHETGIEAVQTLKELEDINAEVKNSIEQIYRQTNITNESAMKIKDAILLITSIADETNLLSLNASIEAARAGEQGKGFAVVANQIQKLAEQSNDSAMKVQEITNMVMEDSAKAVQTMDKVKLIMESQMQKVDLTGSMFEKVQEEIDHSMDGITNIYEKTEGMDHARDNLLDIVQSLTAIAEENAAGTEEASASVTEVSVVVEDISSNAKQLQGVAQTLDEHMKEFRV